MSWIEIGISFIIAIQTAEWLTLPMRLFSFFGTEEFFLLTLPLLYWSVDSALGIRVGMMLVTSNLVNYIGKLLLIGPRPYWVSSHVRGLWPETSFGVPSGHAQIAASVWGIAAAYVKKTWAWIAALVVIFFIGFSRLYLGSHFPHDVLVGWALGGLLLWIFVKFWQPVQDWAAKKSMQQQILIAFFVSLIFIALGYGTFLFRSGYEIPQTWIDNARLASEEDLPAPVSAESPFTSAGVFFGFCAGLAWMHSLGGYSADGSVSKRALRYVLGLAGVAVLYAGLGALFPRGDGLIFYALRYLRYTLVGWWVAGGAPWVFRRVNLI